MQNKLEEAIGTVFRNLGKVNKGDHILLQCDDGEVIPDKATYSSTAWSVANCVVKGWVNGELRLDLTKTFDDKVKEDFLKYTKAPESSAIKFDAEKPDFSLFPSEAMFEIAKAWSFGASKYSEFNWANGFVWRRPAAAALRHIFQWLGGENIDKESNCHHLACACCNLMMLLHFWKTNTGTDNRMTNPMETK